MMLYYVVICFHFTIFVVLETTRDSERTLPILLWFAFILLSLSYWKQRKQPKPCATRRCDLLSFYYLCRTGNNEIKSDAEEASLWFAFILLSLSYWKQHFDWNPMQRKGCDLLSFYYLCRTGNNRTGIYSFKLCVVICFHFTIFVVLETTRRAERSGVASLWFAFILLSLSYWKQQDLFG